MRLGRIGLPAVAVVLATLLQQAPAFAGGQRDVGIEDDVVVVRARESQPGERAGADGDCTYEVIIEDDLAFGVYELDGVRQYSDTGRWLRKTCDGTVVAVGGFFIFPEGAGYNLPDVLAQAIDALDPRAPTWSASPDGVNVAMVTQMPVHLWVDPGYWEGNFGVRVETPSGRVWAEANATPVSATWSTGDGTIVNCPNGGVPFAGDESASACTHTFTRSSATTGELAMSVTVTFDVWSTTSSDPTPQLAGSISRT